MNEEEFNMRVVPHVTHLNKHSGSAEGGTKLKFSGFGFPYSPDPLQVRVDGVPCEEANIKSSNSLECTTGKKPQDLEERIHFAGGPGLERREYAFSGEIGAFMGDSSYPDGEKEREIVMEAHTFGRE